MRRTGRVLPGQMPGVAERAKDAQGFSGKVRLEELGTLVVVNGRIEKIEAGPGLSAAVTPLIPEAAAPVTDHGALSGLEDDDHTQYTTDAEAGAIATGAVSDHEAAENPHPQYAASGHEHVLADITDAGSAAAAAVEDFDAAGAAAAVQGNLDTHEGVKASAGSLGHVRVGEGLAIDGDGILSALAQEGGGGFARTFALMGA
jgi:hypothetical protein